MIDPGLTSTTLILISLGGNRLGIYLDKVSATKPRQFWRRCRGYFYLVVSLISCFYFFSFILLVFILS